MSDEPKNKLMDTHVHVRFKLFALWASVIFFYIYGDYFELYEPGKLHGMIAGNTPFGSISQGILLELSSIMILPCLMPILTLVLPPNAARWMNIVMGVLYSAVMVLAILGEWRFYVIYGLIEIVLTLCIVWCAWTWPKSV